MADAKCPIGVLCQLMSALLALSLALNCVLFISCIRPVLMYSVGCQLSVCVPCIKSFVVVLSESLPYTLRKAMSHMILKNRNENRKGEAGCFEIMIHGYEMKELLPSYLYVIAIR